MEEDPEDSGSLRVQRLRRSVEVGIPRQPPEAASQPSGLGYPARPRGLTLTHPHVAAPEILAQPGPGRRRQRYRTPGPTESARVDRPGPRLLPPPLSAFCPRR
ncbi:hypothetical protein MPTK1_4g21230 [Marchantia polymorpha subsp. ruderalis]|uniref:Uncharacterized protein n=2 Tax=Marchantia polymorpha TaxID=3197 RepID=A0AAF6BC87_MARPO|nr:hypothetical protein MARPO_0101s0069 [Marchantia polymorpha]BBN09621.1 hypothetical protein Mp_4g21230 [Marchantia polymorpha subsp. ruderalis]|eukprot:PTQ32282.1 hypothetical protein MARPO_0101s0069 [Marchantia polymorpha]